MRDSRAPNPYFTNSACKGTKNILYMQIYLHLGMGFSVRGRGGLGSLRLLSPMHGRYYGEKTRAGCLGKRRGLYVLRKTRVVCSSLGGFQGGDDEAAESGAEMGVLLGAGIGGGRFGVLRGWGMAAEMLAVVRITLFPLCTQSGVFQNG